MRKFSDEEIKAMEIVRGIFLSEDRSFISDNCPVSADEQSPLYTADCAAVVLEELIASAQPKEWNLPNKELVSSARSLIVQLVNLLETNGQSLGFDEDNDNLFIAPKGMAWNTLEDNESLPVTSDELDYRSEKMSLCHGKICFVHPSDSTEYLAKCGLRKEK